MRSRILTTLRVSRERQRNYKDPFLLAAITNKKPIDNTEEILFEPGDTLASKQKLLENKLSLQETRINELEKKLQEEKELNLKKSNESDLKIAALNEEIIELKKKEQEAVPNFFTKQLIYAVENCDLNLLRSLYPLTRNIKIEDDNGRSPFYIALENGSKLVVSELIKLDSMLLSIRHKNGQLPIEYLSKQPHFNGEIFGLILEIQAHLYASDPAALTQLYNEATPFCKLWLEENILRQSSSYEPLIKKTIANAYLLRAAQNGSKPDLAAALQESADLQITDDKKQTALHKVIESNDKSSIRFLLREYLRTEVDIHTKDASGKSAFDLARESNKTIARKDGTVITKIDYVNEKLGAYKRELKHELMQNRGILHSGLFGKKEDITCLTEQSHCDAKSRDPSLRSG